MENEPRRVVVALPVDGRDEPVRLLSGCDGEPPSFKLPIGRLVLRRKPSGNSRQLSHRTLDLSGADGWQFRITPHRGHLGFPLGFRNGRAVPRHGQHTRRSVR